MHDYQVHYSACLMQCAERMFVSGQPVLPIQRTLVATGINRAGMVALRDGGPQTLPGLADIVRTVYFHIIGNLETTHD